MGIILGILVQDIRNYIKLERFVKGTNFDKEFFKGFLYLASYVLAVPMAIIGLIIIIFILWVISILGLA